MLVVSLLLPLALAAADMTGVVECSLCGEPVAPAAPKLSAPVSMLPLPPSGEERSLFFNVYCNTTAPFCVTIEARRQFGIASDIAYLIHIANHHFSLFPGEEFERRRIWWQQTARNNSLPVLFGVQPGARGLDRGQLPLIFSVWIE